MREDVTYVCNIISHWLTPCSALAINVPWSSLSPGLAHYGMMMGNIRLISMISMKNICQYHLNVTVFLFQDVTHDKWAACWAPCQHKDCYFKFGYFHYGYNMAIRLSYFVIVIPILVIWYWSKTISIGAIFYCESQCVCVCVGGGGGGGVDPELEMCALHVIDAGMT